MSGFKINTVTLSGNLTRDPELRSTPSGIDVCNFRIATQDRRKQGDNYVDVPMFFDFTIWGGFGKHHSEKLHKGDKVIIAGRLNWREYQDKDGNNRQVVSIVADSCIPVPKNGNGNGNGSSDAAAAPAPAEDPAPF